MSAPRHMTIARCFMVVVICGLVWRLLRFFLDFDMSIDEANVLRDSWARTYAGLLKPLNYAQVLPPAFLWMTKTIDSVIRNEWGVRLVPFLAGIGGMVVFWKLCVEVLRGTARWVAWAVFGVSYVPVVEGACVKGYTIDLLAAMLMFWLMLRWLRGGQHARELVWLAVFAPVIMWFSYTSVFVIGTLSLVFMAYCFKERGRMGRSSLIAGFAFMALTGASALVLYEVNIRGCLEVSRTVGLQTFWHLGYPPLDQPWNIPLWLVQVHTGRGFAWPVGENHFASTLTTVLWVAGLVIYWRRGNRWVWALFVLPHVLLMMAAFLHKYPYGANVRICMFLGPGICLFMGAGTQYLLGRLGHERMRLGYRVWAMLLLCVAIGGMTRDIVLRIREINGPDIRGTLVEAGRVVGTNGQFVLLTGETSGTTAGETSGILAYYLKRYVAQPISYNGEIKPSQAPSGSNLALVTVTTEPSPVEADPFAKFEKRFGKPITLTWSQVARRIEPRIKDRVSVRVYRVGP